MHVSEDSMRRVLCKFFWKLNRTLISEASISFLAEIWDAIHSDSFCVMITESTSKIASVWQLHSSIFTSQDTLAHNTHSVSNLEIIHTATLLPSRSFNTAIPAEPDASKTTWNFGALIDAITPEELGDHSCLSSMGLHLGMHVFMIPTGLAIVLPALWTPHGLSQASSLNHTIALNT